MIGGHDTLELPHGVALAADGLFDPIRRCAIPLNESGRFVVGAAEAGASVRQIAEALAAAAGVATARAERDVASYVRELNARLLVNVRVRGGYLAAAARAARSLLLLGSPQVRRRRRHVDTGSAVRAAATALAGVAPAAAGAGVVAAAPAVVVESALAPGGATFALWFAAAAAGGVALHEAAHAACLRGVPACLATHGIRASVVHAPASAARERVCAAAGPGAPLVASAVLAAIGADAAVAAPAFAVHGLGFAATARDGRVVCGLS